MSISAIRSAIRRAACRYHSPAVACAIAVLGGLVTAPAPALAAVGDRIPFQGFTGRVCQDTAICSASFDVVPAGSRLEINSVSCFLLRGARPVDTISGGLGQGVANLDFAVLNAACEVILRDHAVADYLASNEFGSFWSANHSSFFLVPPGGRVHAVMVSSKVKRSLQINCKIAGEQVMLR